MINVDSSRNLFLEYEKAYTTFLPMHLTESDTRSKILDEILKILGWTEVDILREGYSAAGYFDYSVGIPGFKFIIEAKRIFHDFKIPEKHHVVTLGTLNSGNANEIKQIRNYLVEEGLQYGVITNGKQFIVSKFLNSDGSDWKKNKAVIFNGFEDIKARYIEFYNVLSKKSIVDNSGFYFLNENKSEGKVIIHSISQRDSELIRNSFSSQLTPVITRIFGEIYKYDVLDNKELISECFIENEEIKKNKSDIERIFDDLPPDLGEVIPARNTKNIIGQIHAEIVSDEISIKNTEPPNPIIIIGSKGAGKTTFINYLFNNEKIAAEEKNRPFIYLDFRKYDASNFERDTSHIYTDIVEELYSKYSSLELHSKKVLIRIYRQEIKRKDENTWVDVKGKNIDEYNEKLNNYLEENLKNHESHFIALSQYLIRERRMRICVIMDNIDQFDEKVQEKAYLFGNSLSRKSKCSVIISLREGYYYKWRYKPPFDAFVSNVYHVTAPPYRDVLQKRIDYAIKQLNIEGKTKGDWGRLRVEIKNESVINFLLSVKETLFGDKNSDMLRFLHETTYPNIREGLEVFNSFLLSGHTDVGKYILRSQSGGESAKIPVWEFIKAIALDNKKYYNKDYSKIYNIFNPTEGSDNHFLKLKILKYLLSRVEGESFAEKFLILDEVKNAFVNAGYKLNIIIRELNELLANRLIETLEIKSDVDRDESIDSTATISISLKGYYYLTELKNRVHYLDVVLQDTIIFDEYHYAEIRKIFPTADEKGYRSIEQRILVIEKFWEYLKSQEDKETVESNLLARGICDEMYNHGLHSDIQRVRSAISKMGRGVKSS